MSEWQDIETAPRDGTPFLGWSRSLRPGAYNTGVHYVTWARGDRWVHLDLTDIIGERWCWDPTHWMPLPPAPNHHETGED